MLYVNVLVSSIPLAGIYLLLALGWVVVFRATGLMNFALGQFVMVGAYLYFELLSVAHLPWWIALVLSLLLGMALSAITYLGLLKPVIGQPLFAQVVVTLGLSIVITSLVSMIWGPGTQIVPAPFFDSTYHLFGVTIGLTEICIAGVAIVGAIVLIVLMERTRLGLHMRAGAEMPLLASQGGINVAVLAALSWGIAGALITLGGIAYSQESLLSNQVANIGLLGIAPALLGGLESIKGAVLGAAIVAVAQNLGVLWFGGNASDVSVYVVILLVLLIRPTGLMGAREVRRV